jgi:hypothetical protein
MMLKRGGPLRDGCGMTTLCRRYIAQSDARTAVGRLLAAGVPGADVTVLVGAGRDDAPAHAVTVFPGGVAHARVGGDKRLERMLVAAGLDAAAAAADAQALHGGRVLVLVTGAGLVAKAALDGVAA